MFLYSLQSEDGNSLSWRELFRERFGRSWYRFCRNKISLIGAVMVVSVVLLAVLAPWISPYPRHAYAFTDFPNRFQPPSATHWFGTDDVGRDILTRVIFGYRISLMLVTVVLGISVPVGVILGLVAGYYGGIFETVIMRGTDVFLSLPPLVMALAICAAFTPSIDKAMFAVASIWWTWHCRLVYGVTKSLRKEEFVQASQILGASPLRIIFRDILPSCASPIIVKITIDAGFVILVGAGLSFLGLGVQPPQPGLGTMVSEGATYLPVKWWMTFFPSIAIFYLIMGFNLLGDGLRDALAVEEGA